ncbi:MAG: hypothetical protein Q7V20_23125 [Aquabacterium sp.]|uniref:hypothetical protein n=1 Tax=Aquabacterium sp. TaxID=1872578 RepID=UPI0027221DEE|nr:hypothetical protein [Aquabacterium sp.]MDO9006347.1 hypothetical protein [Aquabacterium sp.]
MSLDRLSQIVQASALDALHPEDRATLQRAGLTGANLRAAAFDAMSEPERIALVRAAGAVPDTCGDAIPMAPARGPVRTLDYLASYPKGENETHLAPAGYAGRKTMKRLDVFDLMAAQSARKGGCLALTDSQIGMARAYRTLTEDLLAGAVRCSSMEAMRSGGGGSREGFTDHRLDMSRRLDLLHKRIGPGAGLAIRRIRPSKRGEALRRNIADRALVDAVCLQDQDMATVLRAHGWAVKGDTVKAATAAVAAALDRMIGPVCRSGIVGAHYGDQPVSMLIMGKK